MPMSASKKNLILSKHSSFPVRLYISLSMNAILKMRTGDEKVDDKILELLEPLFKEMNENYEFSA